MIDLHMHSNCSDGSDDYKTILKKAEKIGLRYISITDHDNCNVYEQMRNDNISKYYSGVLIPGVELQAYIMGFSIELLGYFVDYKIINEEVKKAYIPLNIFNKEEYLRLYKRCIEIGMEFNEDVLSKFDLIDDYYATKYLHSEMRKNLNNKKFIPDDESWESEDTFFRRHISNLNSPFYIDESDLIPSVEQVIGIIRKARGYVFIPHIYQYGENAMLILNQLIKNYDIDGIECFYPTFSKEQTNYLLDFCKKNGLHISGGSDYHGLNRPSIDMGVREGLLDIECKFIKEISSNK